VSRCRIRLFDGWAELTFRLDGDRGQEFAGCVESLKRAVPAWARALTVGGVVEI
jgi:hypothetical protein